MTVNTVNTVYDRHMSALQRVAEKDVIHSSAIGLSLYLALNDLAAALAVPLLPQPQTDWGAHIKRLTEYLDAADRLTLPEIAVDRAIELLQKNAAKVTTADQLAMWLERNEPELYHDPDMSITDGIINAIARRNERVTAIRVELAKVIGERDAADKRCAELEAENEQLRNQRTEIQDDLAHANKQLRAICEVIERHDSVRYAAMIQDNEEIAVILDRWLSILRELALKPAPAITIPHGNGVTHVPVAVLAAEADKPDLTFAYDNTPDDDGITVVADDADGWQTRLRMLFANDEDVLDWLNGLFAGRHQFRYLPKAVRWAIIAAVVRSLYDAELGAPMVAEFNAARPDWMPGAQYIATAYGNGKWASILELAGKP